MDQRNWLVGQYDPALAEVAKEGAGDDEVSVIARHSEGDALPEGVREITRFGEIVTLRVPRARIAELARWEPVKALEIPQQLTPTIEDDCLDDQLAIAETNDVDASAPYTRRPDGVRATGHGVVIAVLDWGIDVAFPSFCTSSGTRFLGLWDQRGKEGSGPGNRWGYGRIFTADDINRALATDHPYDTLHYHPADSDGARLGDSPGAHGTHVMDIAAGNGRGGGLPGVAPDALLVAVELARTTDVLGPYTLGDSASILEAIDWVLSVADGRPCVINMSVGAHGGPHDGRTLVEQGIDRALWLHRNFAVVNSGGNYFTARAHTAGRLKKGDQAEIHFIVPPRDPTKSEIEIWYSALDRFVVHVSGPSGDALAEVGIGQNAPLEIGGRAVGHVYHVRNNTNGDHHVDLFLEPNAPPGTWALTIEAETVRDGRYHAWIERDPGARPRFALDDVVTTTTTGTLCNGRLSITVAAYNPHDPNRGIGVFSSAGPTTDGRLKPEVTAPGVRIPAAQSTPAGERPDARYTTKSGTSMATPHVAGAIALMFEASAEPLEIADTRALLFASCEAKVFDNAETLASDIHRFGYGYLDIAAAERAARAWRRPLTDDIAADAEAAAQAETEMETETETEAETEIEIAMEAEMDAQEIPEAEQEPEQQEEDAEEESLDVAPELEMPPSASPQERLIETASAAASVDELHERTFAVLGVTREDPLDVVAASGAPLGDPAHAGDLLIRRAPIHDGLYSAVVVSPEPEHRSALEMRGVTVERGGAGTYVEVLEVPFGETAVRHVGRQLTDSWGRMRRGQTLYRPRIPHDAVGVLDGWGWREDQPYKRGHAIPRAKVSDALGTKILDLLWEPIDEHDAARIQDRLKRLHAVIDAVPAHQVCPLLARLLPKGDLQKDFDYRLSRASRQRIRRKLRQRCQPPPPPKPKQKEAKKTSEMPVIPVPQISIPGPKPVPSKPQPRSWKVLPKTEFHCRKERRIKEFKFLGLFFCWEIEISGSVNATDDEFATISPRWVNGNYEPEVELEFDSKFIPDVKIEKEDGKFVVQFKKDVKAGPVTITPHFNLSFRKPVQVEIELNALKWKPTLGGHDFEFAVKPKAVLIVRIDWKKVAKDWIKRRGKDAVDAIRDALLRFFGRKMVETVLEFMLGALLGAVIARLLIDRDPDEPIEVEPEDINGWDDALDFANKGRSTAIDPDRFKKTATALRQTFAKGFGDTLTALAVAKWRERLDGLSGLRSVKAFYRLPSVPDAREWIGWSLSAGKQRIENVDLQDDDFIARFRIAEKALLFALAAYTRGQLNKDEYETALGTAKQQATAAGMTAAISHLRQFIAQHTFEFVDEQGQVQKSDGADAWDATALIAGKSGMDDAEIQRRLGLLGIEQLPVRK